MKLRLDLRRLLLGAVMIAISGSVESVWADAGPPSQPTPVRIQGSRDAGYTTIHISRKALARLLSSTTTSGNNFTSRGTTMAAGLALALAVILIGLFLLRKGNRRTALNTLSMFTIVATLFVGYVAWAEDAPGTSTQVPSEQPTLHVVEGNAIELTVSPSKLWSFSMKMDPEKYGM